MDRPGQHSVPRRGETHRSPWASPAMAGAPALVGPAPPPSVTPGPSFVSPTPTPGPTLTSYVVKAGESLTSIARAFATSPRSIAWWNRGTDPSLDPESEGYDPNHIEPGR